MSNRITTRWEWSRVLEANRIFQACTNIANGFYTLNGFLPLPATAQKYVANGVYIPEIDYSSLPHFWDNVGKTDLSQVVIADPHGFTSHLFRLLPAVTEPDIAELTKHWEQIEQDFWHNLEEIVPRSTQSLSTIIVHPTLFGTRGSFSIKKPADDTISVWIRRDAKVTNLAEIILSSLLKDDLFTVHKASWGESEVVIDWLLHDTKLSSLFDHEYRGTLSMVRSKQDTQAREQSDAFLEKIGIPRLERTFRYDDACIRFGDKVIHGLTERETEVCRRLIDRMPRVLTYDELADTIFASDDAYSLATLTKVIDRLREKFERNGISKAYVATERGKGYYLHS